MQPIKFLTFHLQLEKTMKRPGENREVFQCMLLRAIDTNDSEINRAFSYFVEGASQNMKIMTILQKSAIQCFSLVEQQIRYYSTVLDIIVIPFLLCIFNRVYYHFLMLISKNVRYIYKYIQVNRVLLHITQYYSQYQDRT